MRKLTTNQRRRGGESRTRGSMRNCFRYLRTSLIWVESGEPRLMSSMALLLVILLNIFRNIQSFEDALGEADAGAVVAHEVEVGEGGFEGVDILEVVFIVEGVLGDGLVGDGEVGVFWGRLDGEKFKEVVPGDIFNFLSGHLGNIWEAGAAEEGAEGDVVGGGSVEGRGWR